MSFQESVDLMKIGFVTPNYPDEFRVAVLPSDMDAFAALGVQAYVETGFGQSLNIADEAYEAAGAIIVDRQGCYAQRVVFNLKLTQPSDYAFLRPDHILVGWTHPYGSGGTFYRDVAAPLGLTLVDVDSVIPRIFRGKSQPEAADFFVPHMFWKNSYNAGIASVNLGMRHFPLTPSESATVCVLGSGSVAQGAFHELSRCGFIPRMFYRKTLPIFYDTIGTYDIIVNGIEVDTLGVAIMDQAAIAQTKADVAIIEAAADAGNAIAGTAFQTLESPIGLTGGRRYLLVNNAPTIIPEKASSDISKVVSGIIVPAIVQQRARLGLV